MRGSLFHTPRGEAERQVATPFRKYFNTDDFVYCVGGNHCSITIKGLEVMRVQCQPGYYNIWVGDPIA